MNENDNRSFVYSSSEAVLPGDTIEVSGMRGRIEAILLPGTADAADYACFDTGGLLIVFTNLDLQLWPWINSDLVLISREGES